MAPQSTGFGGRVRSSLRLGKGERRRRDFERLAMPLLDRLYRTALGLLRDPADAEDVVQETFLRAYRTFDNFRPGTDESAWLFTILYSIVSNVRRTRRRRPAARSLGEPADDDRELEIPDRAAHEEIVGNPKLHWDHSRARRAVENLPEDFAAAVLLVDVGELSYEEAASVIGCPVGTVRSRLYRARRSLAKELRDLAHSYGLLRAGEG